MKAQDGEQTVDLKHQNGRYEVILIHYDALSYSYISEFVSEVKTLEKDIHLNILCDEVPVTL